MTSVIGSNKVAKKPTSITISNDKHTFTLRIGDKVFVTSRRYDPFGTDTVKAPDYLSIAEVTDIRGGKTPAVRVGGSWYDGNGVCLGYGGDRLEPYDADRELKLRAEDLNHTQMSRTSSALASVQRGQWQVICNDPTKRAAIIALLGDDVPALKETTR